MGNANKVFVYIAEMDCESMHPVKVGISSNPKSRIRSLQTGSPFPIRLLITVAAESRDHATHIESAIHAAFEDTRLSGEWFNAPASDVYATMVGGFLGAILCDIPSKIVGPERGRVAAEFLISKVACHNKEWVN